MKRKKPRFDVFHSAVLLTLAVFLILVTAIEWVCLRREIIPAVATLLEGLNTEFSHLSKSAIATAQFAREWYVAIVVVCGGFFLLFLAKSRKSLRTIATTVLAVAVILQAFTSGLLISVHLDLTRAMNHAIEKREQSSAR